MSKSTVGYWFRRYKSGDGCTKDKQRSGRPRTGRSEANVKAVEDMILKDRRVNIPQIQRTLSLSDGTVDRIIHKDLKFKCVSAKFVPHILNEEQKKLRLDMCRANLELYEQIPDFIQSIITGDESSFKTFTPEPKGMTMQWIRKGEKRPKKALRSATKKSTMFTIFFDHAGVVHAEFAPPKTRITSDFYCTTLARLREKIRVKRADRWKESDFRILHDNASIHTAHHTVKG